VRAAEAGRKVEVLDDALEHGGTVSSLVGPDAAPWGALLTRFARHVSNGSIRLRTQTTAAALYGDDLLVVGSEGAEVVTSYALVLATGAHDGVLAFEGNDLPGVFSARAAGWLLARGVPPGARVLVCAPEGASGAGEAFARAAQLTAAGVCEVDIVRAAPASAHGSGRVKAVVVNEEGGERRFKADALVIDAPRAPAYELCEQAGARLVHEARGFVPLTTRGKIRDGIFAIGEVTGAGLDAAAFADAAEAVVRQM
jgi:sarcosine oxidase subunit alpha